ncbi:RloB domain-containing protein [Maridesulfovibrio ferrireducens]|uniref:RloB domain-containing protein n=1 Tax=Maridesulfovibrio ferrireducens TaxID=246191 RepID=UPI001A18287F|nr:RloB domain-containing protein [Maridesulfovibrio ferrireducens]MBI9112599.1 RloB domain-containing protein [Maridesulfovibrio ferrireducens]
MARPKQSARNTRNKKANILLICDGQTEQNYAKYVLNECLASPDKPIKIHTQIFNCIDKVHTYIERDPKTFDAVIFLKDLENEQLSDKEIDNITTLQSEVQKICGQKKRRASDSKAAWAVFFNYPSIEYWYILHFTERGKTYPNATDVVKHLKAVFPNFDKPMPTNKKEAEIFCTNLKIAIANAKKLSITTKLPYANRIRSHVPLTNPMTEMPNLINMIKKTKPTT